MTSTSTAFWLAPPPGALSASRLRGGGGARRGPAVGLLARAKAATPSDDDGSESDGGADSADEYVGGSAPEGLVQDLTVRRIAGDGRCMFRALVWEGGEGRRRRRVGGAAGRVARPRPSSPRLCPRPAAWR